MILLLLRPRLLLLLLLEARPPQMLKAVPTLASLQRLPRQQLLQASLRRLLLRLALLHPQLVQLALLLFPVQQLVLLEISGRFWGGQPAHPLLPAQPPPKCFWLLWGREAEGAISSFEGGLDSVKKAKGLTTAVRVLALLLLHQLLLVLQQLLLQGSAAAAGLSKCLVRA